MENFKINKNFWSHVLIGDSNDCWIWQGKTDGFGYGQTKAGGKQIRTHRYSWIIANGDIPKGMQITHNCDVPSCVNPNHLKLGTQQSNMAEKVARNRQAKGLNNGSHTRPERRPKGEKIGNSKLKDIDVKFIRYWLDKGYEGKLIAETFNVTNANISCIRNGKTWGHLNA